VVEVKGGYNNGQKKYLIQEKKQLLNGLIDIKY